MKRNVLITGGAGFIGSHLVEHFSKKYPHYNILVVDKLTYAANRDFVTRIITSDNDLPNVTFENEDICHINEFILKKHNIDSIIHLAAESHVDNSITNSMPFIETNVIGTVKLLEAAKNAWINMDNKLFYHISTDEVFGSLGKYYYFNDKSNYDPKSPYSASKASSDHFVRAYGNTYNIPYIVSNCSNNYGERQHHEKLIPKTITNLLNGIKIPVYGTGENIRDWIYVKDHVEAIDKVYHDGKFKKTYLIGGDCELTNLELVKKIYSTVKNLYSLEKDFEDCINFVEDRKGHDYRYGIDSKTIKKDLNWKCKTKIDEGIQKTVEYYKTKFVD